MSANVISLGGSGNTYLIDADFQEQVELLPSGTEAVCALAQNSTLWLFQSSPFSGTAYDFETSSWTTVPAVDTATGGTIGPLGSFYGTASICALDDGRLVAVYYNSTSGYLELRVLSAAKNASGVTTKWWASAAYRLSKPPATNSYDFAPVVRAYPETTAAGAVHRVHVAFVERDGSTSPIAQYACWTVADIGPSTVTVASGASTGTYAVTITTAVPRVRVAGGFSDAGLTSIAMDYAHDGTGRRYGASLPHVFLAVRPYAGAGPTAGLMFYKATYSATTGSWTWGPQRVLDPGVQTIDAATSPIKGAFDGLGRFTVVARLTTAGGSTFKLFQRNAGDTQTVTAVDMPTAPDAPSGVNGLGLTYDAFGNIYVAYRRQTQPAGLQWIKWTRATATFGSWAQPTWSTPTGSKGISNTSLTNFSLKRTIHGSFVGVVALVRDPSGSTTATVNVWADKLAATDQPPAKPTFTYPTAGASLDLTQAQTLTWSAPDPDPGDVQRGYFLQRKVGTGAPHWWNGTDWTSTTEVEVLSASASAAFAAGALGSNGTTYDLAVKVEDSAFNQSPYSDWISVRGSIPPDVTITGPPSQVTTTARPVITWIESDPESDPQDAYRVIVMPFVTFTPNADTDPNLYDSGVVAKPDASLTVPHSLPAGGATYWAAVQVRAAGQWSPWRYRAFSINLVGPGAPILEVLPDDANARVTIDVRSGSNRMGADEADVEASTGGWSATNGTVALDTAHIQHGLSALKVTASGATAMTVKNAARAGTGGFPVVKGRVYTAMVYIDGSVGTRTWQPLVRWTLPSGSSGGADTLGTATAVGTSGFTLVAVTVTAPVTGFAEVRFTENASAAAEAFWFDSFAWTEQATPAWSPGGNTALESVTVSRSFDGGATFTPIRASTSIAFDPVTGADEVYDYEVPTMTPVEYVAFSEIPYQDGTLASAASVTVATQLRFTDWVVKAVGALDPGYVGVRVEVWEPNEPEAAVVYDTARAGGTQAFPVVETEGRLSARGAAGFWTWDADETDLLRAVIDAQDTLLLQDGKRNQWYVVLGPNGRTFAPLRSPDADDKTRMAEAYHVTVDLVEVAPPA